MGGTAERSPVEAFWELARFHARLNVAPTYFGPTTLEVVPPPAWSFGATPEQADELLDLVLTGRKTATTSALADYEAEGQPVPSAGDLGILLDGRGHPRALISVTEVRVVPFGDVDEEHARLEGEGDGSLDSWRRAHAEHLGPELTDDTPVVLERFRVVYQDV